MRALALMLASCAAPAYASGGETCQLVELEGARCDVALCWSQSCDEPVAPHVTGVTCRAHDEPDEPNQPLVYDVGLR